jgi:hypothetical protein
MKTIIVTIITLIFLGTVTTGYGKISATKNRDASAKAIHKIIMKSIEYPDFGYKDNLAGDVEITFALTADGKIEIKKISSGSDLLNNWIKEQLSEITIKDIFSPVNQLYRINIKLSPG